MKLDNELLGCTFTFINKFPYGIYSSFNNGHLLYDIEQELFAGSTGGWDTHVRDILMKEDVIFPKGEGKCIFKPSVLCTLNSGDEVLLVPCSSYEARKGGDIFVYQEFDWQWAFGLKSRSGKLKMNLAGQV